MRALYGKVLDWETGQIGITAPISMIEDLSKMDSDTIKLIVEPDGMVYVDVPNTVSNKGGVQK